MKYKLFSLFAIQIVLSSFICTAFNLVLQSNINGFFPICLIIYSPLMVLINTLLLEKERSIHTLSVINLLFAVIFFCLVLFFCKEKSLEFRLSSIPFFIFFAFFALRLSFKEVSNKLLLRLFDFSIILLFITFFYITRYSYKIEIAYINIFGVFVALFALVIEKQLSDVNKKGWNFIVLCIVLMALLLMCLIAYASYVGSGLIWLWGIIINIGEAISNFFNWLFSILPKLDTVENNNLIPLVTDDPYRRKDVISETLSDNMLEIILVCIGSIIGIIVLVYFLKSIHLSGRKKSKDIHKQTLVRLGLVATIKRVLNSLEIMLECKVFIHRNRNNAIGLYFYLVKLVENSKFHKLPSESPQVFLQRLERTVLDGGTMIDLSAVADYVTLAFFSNRAVDNIEIDNAPELRRVIRVVLYKDRFRSCLEKSKILLKTVFSKARTS